VTLLYIRALNHAPIYGSIDVTADDPPDIVKIVVARNCAELSISNIRP